ncbi:hypothetical protein ALC60_05460 [Trachymyrmex zeteki]|uniref:HAT C-terminal dimerisation domain-containing protein n=1 Tax=Mycetomoellerius zeteki TaxID=64791 RepID=A0A151X5G1_9HYME|nr:hypothetical protein ALC60_05460 [Trachymyrmex zeteki]
MAPCDFFLFDRVKKPLLFLKSVMIDVRWNSLSDCFESYLKNYLSVSRFNMAMTPFHFFANLLDHRYRGEKLSQNQVEEALQYAAAIQLYTATASSAGIERLFSIFGLVHSKIRNRLGTEKVSKLV